MDVQFVIVSLSVERTNLHLDTYLECVMEKKILNQIGHCIMELTRHQVLVMGNRDR